MTRNCFNVMQKCASMEKEAGAWDKIMSTLYRRFPKMSVSSINDLASKLYTRRASRALIRREGNSVARALNTIQGGAGRTTPAKLEHARKVVAGARFNPADTNRLAHVFNQQLNGARHYNYKLPHSAYPDATVGAQVLNYDLRSLPKRLYNRIFDPIVGDYELTGYGVKNLPVRQVKTYGNGVLPVRGNPHGPQTGVYRAPRAENIPGAAMNVSPYKRTTRATDPDPVKVYNR